MAIQAKAPIARWTLFHSLLCVTLVLLASTPSHAQTQSSSTKKKSAPANPITAVIPAPVAPAPAPTPPPPDPLNRGTPHGAVIGFLRAAESSDYVQAAKYLNTNAKNEARGIELAKQLKALLDLGTSTDLNNLSRLPEGNLNDDLPPNQERVGIVITPAGQLEILLDRVDRPNEQPIWLFSQETLRGVPDAFESVELRDPAHYFPQWMSHVKFFSLPFWRWMLAAITLALIFLLARILSRILLWLLNKSLRNRTPATATLVAGLRRPVFWLMTAIAERITASYSITALSRSRWQGFAYLTAMIAGAWLIIRLADIFAAVIRNRLTMRMQIERATFIAFLSRVLKILVCIILIIMLLTKAGVNVSALVTGLGIGGIALALAAQKTLSDLFGGISIVMRGAVRVGDFCTIGSRQGTIEEIGISAIRMRTLDRTVVTIPNSKVAEIDLENSTMRDQFWLHQVFTLRFDTSWAVIQRVLSGMVQILKSHPDVDPASARVRLINLTNAGPQIEIYAYYRKPGADWSAFLAEQEPIILEMMRLVEAEGTAIVAPVGVLQMNPDKMNPTAALPASEPPAPAARQ